jgi:hypothetical protein
LNLIYVSKLVVQNALFFLILLALNALCWFFVFNEPARKNFLKAKWRLGRWSKERKEMDEGMMLASLVISGCALTIFTLCLIVAAIAKVSGDF